MQFAAVNRGGQLRIVPITAIPKCDSLRREHRKADNARAEGPLPPRIGEPVRGRAAHDSSAMLYVNLALLVAISPLEHLRHDEVGRSVRYHEFGSPSPEAKVERSGPVVPKRIVLPTGLIMIVVHD